MDHGPRVAGEKLTVVTGEVDWSAERMLEAYKKRWHIERFPLILDALEILTAFPALVIPWPMRRPRFMSKINEVRANPLYLREKRRSPRRIARWIFILAPTSVAAMAVIWGLIHGGSWSHLTDIPRLAVAHFPSLARKIVSEPSDLVLPAFMVILGGMMIHTPMSLWIRWNHPDIRCLRRDMYLTYLSTGAFFEGIFWGRMIPKIYAYGIPALFVSCILAIQGFWRLGLAMAIIPVDLLLWGAMSAGFAYRGNMLKPVGLAIMMPLAFVLHPFAWILIQNILPIDTLPYRLIDLLLGPSIPAIYGIKILVAIYIYRKLAKAGYPEDKV